MSINYQLPPRDNIEICIARKCGFYIRGKQQGLVEPEISMPILMTKSLHEMMVEYADEIRLITKAVYDVEMQPLKNKVTYLENRCAELEKLLPAAPKE